MDWHSWLLISCFLAVSAYGLRLAWLWCYRPRYQRWRRRTRLTANPHRLGRAKRHLYYGPYK